MHTRGVERKGEEKSFTRPFPLKSGVTTSTFPVTLEGMASIGKSSSPLNVQIIETSESRGGKRLSNQRTGPDAAGRSFSYIHALPISGSSVIQKAHGIKNER